MVKNLRQNALILVAVVCFLALGFAANADAQTSKKPVKPAPDKKTTKKHLTPGKKTAKDVPTAKTKIADKKAIAKSSAKDTAPKDKTSTKNKQNAAKTASEASSKTDRKKDSKSAANSKSNASNSKTAAKSVRPEKMPKSSSSASKKSAPKTTSKKTASRSKEQTVEKTPADSPQIIVTDVTARIRRQARGTASELTQAKLGTILQVVEKTPSWYRVQFSSNGKTSSGWISADSADSFNSTGKDEIYRRITDRYYKADGMNFATASEIYEFLTRAATESENTASAELELKRLLALRAALKAVPAGKAGETPYRDFLKSNEKSVVFSEPAAAWLINSGLFWDLHKKYDKSPLADEIAWQGAQNPLPGECKGFVNCHLFYARVTTGEYLNLHPNGKRNLEALRNLTNLLEPIASGLSGKTVYAAPTAAADRAEFNNLIAELRTIVSRLPLVAEKEKTLRQLKKIAEGFR